jgi:ectoine hydroxylase-related dioxygenase (phytanoyl-CoA dioxygenase family)
MGSPAVQTTELEAQHVTPGVTRSDIEFFQRTGAVCLRNTFDEHWIDLLARGVARNLANPSRFFQTLAKSEDKPTFVMDYNAWPSIPEYKEFIRRSPIGEIAGTLMGWNEVIEDNIFCSENGQSIPTLWHQDASYYEISGAICSIWIPLDEITKDDCLAIVSGSHTWDRTFLPTSFFGKRERLYNHLETLPVPFERMIDVDKDLDNYKYDILSWDMKVGDCIALDGRVVHGKFRSDSGRSLIIRRVTLRFVGEDSYWDKNDFSWLEMEMGHGILKPGDRLNCYHEQFPLVWSRR